MIIFVTDKSADTFFKEGLVIKSMTCKKKKMKTVMYEMTSLFNRLKKNQFIFCQSIINVLALILFKEATTEAPFFLHAICISARPLKKKKIFIQLETVFSDISHSPNASDQKKYKMKS